MQIEKTWAPCLWFWKFICVCTPIVCGTKSLRKSLSHVNHKVTKPRYNYMAFCSKIFLLFFKVLKRIFFILLRQSMHDYTFFTSINGNVKRKKLLWIEYVPLCGQGKIFFGTSLGQMGKQLQAGASKAELGLLGFVHSRLQVGYKSDR